MRAVVQRVTHAALRVAGEEVAKIGPGLVVLVSVGQDDTEEDGEYLAKKITELRIFNDQDDKMNLSLVDVDGAILAVSQFTLHADARRGRRPSYSNAAPPATAEALYNAFVNALKALQVPVATGVFQAMMQVEIHNDGPVTILLDSKRLF